MKKQLIKDLKKHLAEKPHIFLKALEAPEAIDDYTDLDILMDKDAVTALDGFLKAHPSIKRITRKVKRAVTYFSIVLMDNSFLMVDALTALERKGMEYLSVPYLMKNRIFKNGYFTYTSACLFEHVILFNYLNHAAIPQKYIEYGRSLSQAEQQQVFDWIKKTYSIEFNNWDQLLEVNPEWAKQFIQTLKQRRENKPGIKALRYISWAYSEVKFRCNSPGRVITFTGVDGAGKSTILTAVKLLMEKKYRNRIIVRRHRPSVLPILSSYVYGKDAAEAKAAATLPRQGKNTSTIGSILRFAYYYIDYLLGQIYVFLRYQLRGYTVLYDRYYFDFIVDPKRTNLQLPKWIVTGLGRFIKKGDLNILLYAKPDQIIARKQELCKEDIIELTKNYRAIFENNTEKIKDRYVAIENNILSDTIQTTLSHFQKVAI